MIKTAYRSNGLPLTLSLDVYSSKLNTVRIVAYDPSRRNTKYLDRIHEFQGDQNFLIRMPQSPKKTVIEIISKKGEKVELVDRKVVPLQTQMDIADFGDKRISNFVIFCQKFADRAGYLSPGKYRDDTGEYEITYMPTIKDDNGRELTTPARISSKTGIVQVSQRIFTPYTIPGRLAILLHEFCHVFANRDMHSELEADFHAAQIYCALGYPRVELLYVFAKVFYHADTNLNRLRMEKLIEFVNRFDDNVTSIKYGK